MNNKYIQLAIEEAKKSEHKQKIGCIIFDKKNIISKDHNHPQKSIKSITKKFINWPASIHAEVGAIIKAKQDLKGMSILVIRINKLGHLKMAKPCQHCFGYISYVGIKNIYYSDKYGRILKYE